MRQSHELDIFEGLKRKSFLSVCADGFQNFEIAVAVLLDVDVFIFHEIEALTNSKNAH